MNWRPWQHREAKAEAEAKKAVEELKAAEEQLRRVEAQRPEAERVSRALRRETIEINGWTQRAKKAFS
jgi:flagellar biosynthesis chaperone FliJ